jgi:ankyrin repeat protein
MPKTENKPSKLEKEAIKAVNSGNLAKVRALLQKHSTLVHAKDKEGSTLLHQAAWKGYEDIAKVLIELGADVNVQDNRTHRGGTPLHAAAHGNQKAVAALLIAHGADVRAKNCEGRIPMDETQFHDAKAVAKLLSSSG